MANLALDIEQHLSTLLRQRALTQLANVVGLIPEEITQAEHRICFIDDIAPKIDRVDLKRIADAMKLRGSRRMHLDIGIRYGFGSWNPAKLGLTFHKAGWDDLSQSSPAKNGVIVLSGREPARRCGIIPKREITSKDFCDLLNSTSELTGLKQRAQEDGLHIAIQALPVHNHHAEILRGADASRKMRMLLTVSTQPIGDPVTGVIYYDNSTRALEQNVGPVVSINMFTAPLPEAETRKRFLARLLPWRRDFAA